MACEVRIAGSLPFSVDNRTNRVIKTDRRIVF